MNVAISLQPKLSLTAKQRDLLEFIKARIAADGLAPSYSEMGGYLGLASTSGVHRLVKGLVERGHLYKMPANRARALALVPEGGGVPLMAVSQPPAAQPNPPSDLSSRPGLVRIRKIDKATAAIAVEYAVRLPTALALELIDHCQSRREAPDDVVITAIVRYMRGRL